MNILGIDAATKKTGYCIMDKDSGTLLKYGIIKTISDNFKDRIKEVHDAIVDIIKSDENIKVVVVEDVPVNAHSNLKTGKELSVLQGVILGICFEQKLPCITYAPSGWRSIVGTYNGTRAGMKRNFQKELAVKKVNELYGLDFNYFVRDTKKNKSDDDVAEAILIARALYLEKKEG